MARTIKLWVLLLVTCVLLSASGARALQCPQPQPSSQAGVIPESAVRIEDLSALLGSGDRANRIGIIVHNLRQAYPAAPKADIVNCLVGAFCPVVNQQNGLGDAEKRARIDQFTQQVSTIVF